MRTKRGHFLYVLLCRGNRLYTGYAVDVAKRFDQHKLGTGARFTKAFPPQKIVLILSFASKSHALRTEYWFKQKKRSQKESLLKHPQAFIPEIQQFLEEGTQEKSASEPPIELVYADFCP